MQKKTRAPRKEVHEQTTVHSGESTYDVELKDISESGAAIEFDLTIKSSPSFDIGRPLDLDVNQDDCQSGRVIRHYDGGFAMTFDHPKAASD